MTDRQLLVYAQANPASLASVKRFHDLENTEMRLSHSSKTSISLAVSMGFHEIVVAGYAPVLREAIARGGTSAVSIPLCDDPLRQAQTIPKEEFTHIIIGENSDWIFSGSSLAGALAHSRNLKLQLFNGATTSFPSGSVIVVKDFGVSSSNIDIRRLKGALDTNPDAEPVLGEVTFSKLESTRTEAISGEPKEIAITVTRKLRRLAQV